MTDMAKHRDSTAPLRRARFAAWTVALSMAGTTMAFQVYHAIQFGHMPPVYAALYGVVPLLIALCILEFVAEWGNAPWWATTAAYVILAGAMFLSAASTGSVVLHAAPNHMSWVFGLLMDGAALLAVHFILNGPTAAAAAAAAAERDTAMRAAAAAEQAALQTRIADLAETLAATEAARNDAAQRAAQAETKTAQLERKLAAQTSAKANAKTARKTGAAKAATAERKTSATPDPGDVDARTEALRILSMNPDISGADLGTGAGMSKRWGQLHRAELAGLAAEFDEDQSDMVSGDGEGGGQSDPA